MEKILFILHYIFSTIFVLTLFVSPAKAEKSPAHSFQIISGNVTGVYYPTAGAFCRIINKNEKNLYCSVKISEGSFSTIETLKDLPKSYALIQNDIAEEEFTTQKHRNIRKVLKISDEIFTILVKQNSDIKTFENLIGKTISFGNKGNGAVAVFKKISKTKKIPITDFNIAYMDPSHIAEALCSNEIDAAIFAVSQPNGLVQEVLQQCDTRFLPLSRKTINVVTSKYKNYSKSFISSKYYPIPSDALTISVESSLYSTTTNSTENVYLFTKTILDNINSAHALHPVMKKFKSKTMLPKKGIIPMHPGAQKYFLEKNFFK
ncbi:MAG: TAXI family TRAP transporter solute-binding subunit [Rickettsiales bacterium]